MRRAQAPALLTSLLLRIRKAEHGLAAELAVRALHLEEIPSADLGAQNGEHFAERRLGDKTDIGGVQGLVRDVGHKIAQPV